MCQHKSVSGKGLASTPSHFAHSPPSTTKVPYATSLDPDEMPSNSASHLDPSWLTLRQHFYKL